MKWLQFMAGRFWQVLAGRAFNAWSDCPPNSPRAERLRNRWVARKALAEKFFHKAGLQ